jgi:hypothetical protein
MTAAAGLAAFTAPTARHTSLQQHRAMAFAYVPAADDLVPSRWSQRPVAQASGATVAFASATTKSTVQKAGQPTYSTQASTVESTLTRASSNQGGNAGTQGAPSPHSLPLFNVQVPAVDMNVNLSMHLVSLDTVGDASGYTVKISVDGLSAKSAAISGFDGSFLPSQHQELVNVPTIAIQEGLSISGALAYSDTGNICVTIDDGGATCTGINPLNVTRLNPTLILDLSYSVEGISDKVHKEVGVQLAS